MRSASPAASTKACGVGSLPVEDGDVDGLGIAVEATDSPGDLDGQRLLATGLEEVGRAQGDGDASGPATGHDGEGAADQLVPKVTRPRP